jgi:PST family polysaccharide transporter
MATNLAYYLDRFDDFWVGTQLGDAMLGFYSKAFEFSHYPTRLIAAQLIAVFAPVFARLQQDRIALSRSFYRSAYVILRTGALSAGLLFLIIPEFIHYVIGDKWLPMLWAFRLMLAYAVINPVIILIKRFFLTTGQPKEALKTSAVQAIFFTPLVILGARLAGINGVALAADGMLIVGVLIAYRPLRRLIDFSLYRLFGPPLVALTISLLISLWAGGILLSTVWLSVLVKLALYLSLYAGLTLAMERKEAVRGIRMLWSLARAEVKTGS